MNGGSTMKPYRVKLIAEHLKLGTRMTLEFISLADNEAEAVDKVNKDFDIDGIQVTDTMVTPDDRDVFFLETKIGRSHNEG